MTTVGGANAANFFEKTLVFPADADSVAKIEMASRLVPSPKQLAWQDLELTAFLHFGVNTFTGREWGDGSEDPSIFNPEKLDADQWVKTLKDSGFNLVILTAKHHDGFCLWPTATTRHSVASSPWRGGNGDVMADLKAACDKYDMKLGVYLSPWDRNAPCYGDSEAYNDMFVAQLTELLTNYGRIDEVWFDGACGEGPNGKKQVYDWTRFKQVIADLQPNAVVAIMGDDVRWVGNEKGQGRETEWSATALTPGIYPDAAESNQKLGLFAKAPDLGGRQVVAKADKLYWWPSEVDVSIRPGWFYHEKEQPRSLYELANIYLNSVGRNSVLLLNIPPDTDGLIHDNDVQRLKELRGWIDDNFSENLVAKAEDNVVYTLQTVKANSVVLKEDISKGQRVEAFEVLGRIDGNWQVLCSGTTIGHKRILMFPDTDLDAVKVRILSSRGETYLAPAELYRVSMPELVAQNEDSFRTIPVTDWRIISATTDNIAEAYQAIDENPLTFWKSADNAEAKEIVIDMGRVYPVAGFVYKVREGEDKSGTIFKYRFLTSLDGETWTEAVTPREFSNIVNNPIDQKVYFNNPSDARYIRLIADSEIEGQDYVTIGELSVLMPVGKRQPKDDETKVWPDPAAKLMLQPGDDHPTVKGCKFLYSEEFDMPCQGVPSGWTERIRKAQTKYARIDTEKCVAVLPQGFMRLSSYLEPDSVDNGYGEKVSYSTFSMNTPHTNAPIEGWGNFREGQRIEVRARHTSTSGINNAIWFMGNNERPWPANGEIDLLETPQKTPNDRAHFTLHSEHHYAGVVGGSGSVTASIDLDNLGDWNIYWLEWYPDKIVGGVNGMKFFEHTKGADGNEDWPWSDPNGFFMLLTSGLSTDPAAWPGAVDPTSWDPHNPPHLDLDWIRVFTLNP